MFAFIHPPILPAVGSFPNTYPRPPKVQNLVTSNDTTDPIAPKEVSTGFREKSSMYEQRRNSAQIFPGKSGTLHRGVAL